MSSLPASGSPAGKPQLAETFSEEQVSMPLSLGALLAHSAQRWPAQDAVVFSAQPLIGNIRWTYQTLDQMTTRLAQGMLSFGYRPGDRIAVLGPNHPEWILLEYAIAKAGLVLVALNPLYKGDELAYTISDSGVVGLFHADRIGTSSPAQTLQSIRTRIPLLKTLHSFSDGITDLMESEDSERSLPAVDPNALFMIQYTSGTTGSPKAVHISHQAIATTASNAYLTWGFNAESRVCHGFPLFHIGGSGHSTPAAAAVGATTFPIYIFKAPIALDILEKERCTAFVAVPTMLIAMLDEPGVAQRDFSSLKTIAVGGAAVTPDLIERCKRVFGAEVINCYGQTETCGVTTCTTANDSIEKKTLTSGKALSGVSLSIRDSAGTTLARNQIGQLYYSGPGRMIGYQQSGGLGSVIPAEQWIASGDLAIMDNDGYVRIVGRAKEMIIRGGENISPLEIETYMLEHPDIKDVAVVGLFDQKYGEEVCAAICIQRDSNATTESIRIWCSERISRWKVPKYIAIVEEFPLTPSGKIKKYLLRQQMEQLFGLSEPPPPSQQI